MSVCLVMLGYIGLINFRTKNFMQQHDSVNQMENDLMPRHSFYPESAGIPLVAPVAPLLWVGDSVAAVVSPSMDGRSAAMNMDLWWQTTHFNI